MEYFAKNLLKGAVIFSLPKNNPNTVFEKSNGEPGETAGGEVVV